MSLSQAIDQEAREMRKEFEENNARRKSISGWSSAPSAHKPAAPLPAIPYEPLSPPRTMPSTRRGFKPAFPGDLGPGDPRRSSALPGDLGPNDPRHSSARPATSDGTRTSARSLSPTRLTTGDKSPSQRRLSDAGSNRPEMANGGVRLQKDYDNESPSSDEDDDDDLDTDGDTDGDFTDRESKDRGRQRMRLGKALRNQDGGEQPSTPTTPDPTILVTPPITDQSSHQSRKSDVHPSTAFDFAASSTSTPVHSDDEEHLSDLRRAQRLSLTISPIHSTPSAHRVIRQVIRGDYLYFQRQAEEGRRRQRVYLVATDLSSEAEYALEWTIGTVLRDGDTLLAVYAVDEETGTGGGPSEGGIEIGHGADVVKDTATIVRSMTAENVASGNLPQDGSTARMAFAENEAMTKAERDRFRAAEDISQRCVKLLRKTRLQVRVVVEVFHCKSPRHMITEVIDFLSPTLTILGSRGRSQLKGVLLGSFSNYLVTKSSVPVMVARKRLRKHTKQRLHKDGLPVAQTGDGRMRYGRMSNVLEAPGGSAKRVNRLAGAKID